MVAENRGAQNRLNKKNVYLKYLYCITWFEMIAMQTKYEPLCSNISFYFEASPVKQLRITTDKLFDQKRWWTSYEEKLRSKTTIKC